MKAKEFYNSLENKKAFTKLTSTGISDNRENVFEFAESYHRSKFNNVDLSDVRLSLLKEAKCPNCDGSGAIMKEIVSTGTRWVDDGNGNPLPEPIPIVDYEPEPCEWCYLRDKAVGNETQ